MSQIKGRIDQWYEVKIRPIHDVLAETEEEEEEEQEEELRGRGGTAAGEVLLRIPGQEEAQERAKVQVPGLPDQGGQGGPKRLPQQGR